MWVKAKGLTSLGVRFNDSSGQCHQKTDVKLADTSDWQPLVLRPGDIAGGEHWGGADDGKWHGPITGFGINIGKNTLPSGATRTALYIDDVEYVAGLPSTAG